jgi:FkbM family methyltransferase
MLTSLQLQYIRSELPAWGRLLPRVSRSLRRDELRTINLKPHGLSATLNLADSFERTAFILGRYSDLGVQLGVNDALRAGDACVDIGANIGFLSLIMAAKVGASGHVRAFEPNPPVFARLQAHMERNALAHVRCVHAALADSPGELTLKVLRGNLGLATLRDIGSGETKQVLREEKVQVRVGDDELADLVDDHARGVRPLRLVKIDVEGFECRVLAGLRRTLREAKPIVVTEAVDEHLRAAGSSLAELKGMMRSAGYRGWHLHQQRTGLASWAVRRIDESMPAPTRCYNIVWEHAG